MVKYTCPGGRGKEEQGQKTKKKAGGNGAQRMTTRKYVKPNTRRQNTIARTLRTQSNNTQAGRNLAKDKRLATKNRSKRHRERKDKTARESHKLAKQNIAVADRPS